MCDIPKTIMYRGKKYEIAGMPGSYVSKTRKGLDANKDFQKRMNNINVHIVKVKGGYVSYYGRAEATKPAPKQNVKSTTRKSSSGSKVYSKWVSSVKSGLEIVRRLEKTHPSITLFDGNEAGYKTGYVVVSKTKINGWDIKTLRS